MIRRLAAILAADVADYSRLMHKDEQATHDRFRDLMSNSIESALAQHNGRMVKSTGDGFLAEFPSAVQALQCAIQFQQAIAVSTANDSDRRRLRFRVGINIGDVIIEEGEIYGDGVNIAAGVESLADPGGIFVTDAVYQNVRGRLPCDFEDLGSKQVKNIAQPLHVFRAYFGAPGRPARPLKRRMAAIMVGDIIGYSAMMEKSEEKTIARLSLCQSLISEKVASLDGRIFNRAGDAVLAEFPSPINALRCAVEIGAALAGIDGPDVEPLRMRFGVHIADVAVHGDDLIGDGVNLTARIQQTAAPGAVWVSGVLFDHIRRNSPFAFDDLGERRFKNLSEPIRIYQVRGEIGAHRLQSAPTKSSSNAKKRPSSVAIMPFRISNGNENQRFLAEGLTEELIVELGRFRRLCVASRSASFALADRNPDPVSVGEMLRVRYVLDGQVRKVGKNIRIALTLSETEAGSVVWSDKITRPFEDLMDMIDETVSKIAATVVGRLEDASMVAARRRPPENIEAFECLLRGIEYHRLGGVTQDYAREAVKWFSKAIEADPYYAAAYAGRVCASSWLPEFSLTEGERDIRRALELDPCDPEVNRILGFIELLNNNFNQAKLLSLKAMEMNPTDAYIKARSAAVMTYVGEPLRSLSLLDEAEALDPLLPVWCIEERGIALYALERYPEALEALGRLVFQTYRSRLYRAAALIALDRPDEARRLTGEAIASNSGLTTTKFMSKECYQDLEKRQTLQNAWKRPDCQNSD
jgi:class 3 adenylate cyclase/TolB-like protein